MIRKNLLLLLLFIWIAFGFFNVFYNTFKIPSEINGWLILSDQEKRIKIFGEIHNFFRFVDKNTPPDSKILFVSEDLRTFYLSKYYMYPKLTDAVGIQDEIKDIQNFDYIATFNQRLTGDFVPIATFSGNIKGYLYELK